MSYEELVERCARELWLDRYPDMPWESGGRNEIIRDDYRGYARAVLAEVFRTLETVTEEMNDEANLVWKYGSPEVWLAMLRASPLVPPKDAP